MGFLDDIKQVAQDTVDEIKGGNGRTGLGGAYRDVVGNGTNVVKHAYGEQLFPAINQGWGEVKNFYGNIFDRADAGWKNLYGEATGANYDRQKQWEQRVVAEAAAEQERLRQNQLRDRENADIAMSRAGLASRNFGGNRGGIGLGYMDASMAAQQDFLGLR